MSILVNGIRIAYSDVGAGSPIVFVHGFPLNRTMWRPQVEALSSGHRVVTIDLRGHGESDAPLWRYRVEEFADDVAAVLDHLGLAQVVLAGLSMGGYVAFAFARRHRGRLRGLVLADTRAPADTDEGRAGRFRMAQAAQTNGASAVADAMLPKLLAPISLQSRPELVSHVRAMIETMRVSGIAGDLMAMADRPESVSLLPTLHCPTLVVVGEDDQATPVADARFMAERLPRARLAVIPQAGHLPNLEQPELFNRTLREFLATLTS